MPNTYPADSSTPTRSTHGKNSLTLESVVCSQLELQRRAASFSRRRSTMCRRSSQYLALALGTNTMALLGDLSTSVPFDTSQQASQSADAFNSRDRTSVANSLAGVTLDRVGERRPLVSTLRRENSVRMSSIKKVRRTSSRFAFDVDVDVDTSRIVQDEGRSSKWSIDFHKETQHYGSLRSRLIEEYNDCESMVEFSKKTVLVLLNTSRCLFDAIDLLDGSTCVLEAATIFLGILLILPIIMMSVGEWTTTLAHVHRRRTSRCQPFE
jgi:hypothetical protein